MGDGICPGNTPWKAMSNTLLRTSALILFLAGALAVPLFSPEENGIDDIELDEEKYFAPNPEALPNVKGVTDIRGEVKDYKYRIGNIVPRECDASFSLKVSYKNGAPTLHVVLKSTDAKLEKGKAIKKPKLAKLVDIAVDYKIEGTGWLTKWTVNEKGTLDLVLSIHVDAEIAYDKKTKTWKIDKDQISLQPQGEFELDAQGWLSALINPAFDVVFNDFVMNGLARTVKWYLPKMSHQLPEYVQDAIDSHFEESPETELKLNGQLSWFLPTTDGKGTKLLQFFWGKSPSKTPSPTPTPTKIPKLAKNVLALPVAFSDTNETNNYDYEIGNIIPHRVDVKLDVELRTDDGTPELHVRLGGTTGKVATLDVDVDYFVEQHTFPYFKDSGTVVLMLDTRMGVVLQLLKQAEGEYSWKLKDKPPPGAIKMDAEMQLKDSKLAPLLNPILRFLFNDWLEQQLADYAAAHICPDIPKYIPQQYTNLYGSLLAKAAEGKIHFNANIDLKIPRKSTTVYLQDRLAQQL